MRELLKFANLRTQSQISVSLASRPTEIGIDLLGIPHYVRRIKYSIFSHCDFVWRWIGIFGSSTFNSDGGVFEKFYEVTLKDALWGKESFEQMFEAVPRGVLVLIRGKGIRVLLSEN